VSEENHPGVFVRSVYFTDPDGIMLELAATTTRAFGSG
jgi:catechol 2,3-dioxygenase-like lactoylglutathione lyase family enzyme